MRLDLPGAGGTVPAVRAPILMSGGDLTYQRASPRLGEHTTEVLAELGLPAGEIERLRQAKVVGGQWPAPPLIAVVPPELLD